MKIEVTREELLRVLGWIVKFTDPKSVSFGAKCVRFVAEDGEIRASATNLEISGSEKVGGTIAEPGAFACDGKALVERVRFFASGPISITYMDGKVHLQVGSQRYALKAAPVDEMPKIPGLPTSKQTQIPAAALARLVGAVSHAICDDWNRAHLNSALIECDATSLRMVATDGHLLTKSEATIVAGRPFEMLVRKGAVILLGERCASVDEGTSVQISTKGDQQFFQIGTALLVAQSPNANFPPYDQVIPKARRHAEVNRDEFVRALKVTGIDDGRVGVEFTQDQIRVSGVTSDGESASIEVSAQCAFAAGPIGVSSKRLAEQLGQSAGDLLHVDVGGELDPVLVTAPKDAGFVAVHMPMRL